jgi:hypothetical protein
LVGSPQPRSGAPKAQGLTAAIAVAALSPVPSIALDSTDIAAKIDTSTTSRIYTSLTDVAMGYPLLFTTEPEE